MEARFAFAVDPSVNLVRITMSGFFEQDDIRRFVLARDEAHRGLTGGGHDHLTLVDIRGMKIQSQSSVTGFAAVLSDPAVRSRRIAFVVAGNLARAQLARAADGRGGQFRTIEDAERWLLAPDDMAVGSQAA